jgi:hypothetical protein
LALRKADAPSANATDVTVESRAEPEVQKESLQSARPLDIKPTESGVEAKPPKTFTEPETFTERGRWPFTASRDRPADVAVAPQATTNVPYVEFLASRKADAPSANATDVTVESRDEPEVQKESLQSARPLDIKPTESGIEAKPPETFTERQRWFFAVSRDASTCLQSASDVRQNSPGAWPSWTLRALGHEGTRCWYAATRFKAHHHRSEMRRKETAKETALEFPGGLFGVQ